ncbi:MAG: hypothetical protein V1901_03930 [Patescibacteria group bacterium]
MKTYKIKPTKKQLKIIKQYWIKFAEKEIEFYTQINKLEKELEKEVKIKNIEFFINDNECVGVGNSDRTMKLIQLR